MKDTGLCALLLELPETAEASAKGAGRKSLVRLAMTTVGRETS
jgi:hypothetical protein